MHECHFVICHNDNKCNVVNCEYNKLHLQRFIITLQKRICIDIFVIECPIYEEERKSLFESASKFNIHNSLSNSFKCTWIMSKKNATLIKELAYF